MAAVQGHTKAQYCLGVFYEKGIGIHQDLKEALKWKLAAAEKGEPRAQNHCGVRYARGSGVQKNYRKAYMWLRLAVMQCNRPAKKNISILTDKMTPVQISDASQMVREWKPKT
jgi:hypothetical protein